MAENMCPVCALLVTYLTTLAMSEDGTAERIPRAQVQTQGRAALREELWALLQGRPEEI